MYSVAFNFQKCERKNVNFIILNYLTIQIKNYTLHVTAKTLQYLVLIRGYKKFFARNKNYYFLNSMIYYMTVIHNINIILHFLKT
jgi:hypothetical protein